MNFGYAKSNVLQVKDQEKALKLLAELSQRATINPLVRNTALRIVAECASRDDACELAAIYNAVKHGHPEIPSLRNGVKYVADPRYADYFESPVDVLVQCSKQACGSDCDGHAALIAALAGSLGWRMGLRAWGRKPSEYEHVYAVALFPKRAPHTSVVALDTTVDSFKVGSEPPRAHVLNAYFI